MAFRSLILMHDFAQIFVSYSFSRKNQFHFSWNTATILSRSGSHFKSFSSVVSITCLRSLLPDSEDAIYYHIYFRRLLTLVPAIRRLVIQGSKTVIRKWTKVGKKVAKNDLFWREKIQTWEKKFKIFARSSPTTYRWFRSAFSLGKKTCIPLVLKWLKFHSLFRH